VDPAFRRPVDVLVDKLEMCHSFEFKDRLKVCTPTLPLAELLLSKLQVVKINRKDVLDALILLAEHPLGDSDGGGSTSGADAAINVPRIAALTSADWGWWRTITENLGKLRSFVETDLTAEELDTGRPRRFDPVAQIEQLESAIERAPKSTKWKFRARVGDRVAWYELPEEVGHCRD